MIESLGPYERMRRQVVRGVAWLMLVAAVLAGVIALGRWSHRQLTMAEEHDQVAIQAIECETPLGMSRVDFLDEVRYISRLPASIALADAEAKEKLRAAFELHPWVSSVAEMQPRRPNKLRVRLVFRRPALAVSWDDGVRVVDDLGVLLPLSALATGLPKFEGVPSAPGRDGQPWPDPEVVRQAMLH